MLDRATRGRLTDAELDALQGYIAQAQEDSLGPLREALEEHLEALPVPMRHSRTPLSRRRQRLLRLRDRIDARRGNPDALLRHAREAWLCGGSHVEYLRLLLKHGQVARAISMAMALLDANACTDREALEGVLREAALAPSGWVLAVARFAEHPTESRWRELQRFTPGEVYDARVRYTVRILVQLGVEAETVFHFATLDGATPEAIGLVEEGQVDQRVVEQRAWRGSRPSALWLGLAARAACTRGDHLGTVRLLREATRHAVSQRYDTEKDVAFILEHGDDALVALLRSAGLLAKA